MHEVTRIENQVLEKFWSIFNETGPDVYFFHIRDVEPLRKLLKVRPCDQRLSQLLRLNKYVPLHRLVIFDMLMSYCGLCLLPIHMTTNESMDERN